MSNHRSIKDILLHHRQVDAGKATKANRAEHRRITFELNRYEIKLKVEADRQHLALCALVFLVGLILITSCLVYAIGVILYG